MTTVKGLAIVALLVGGSSLAMAQDTPVAGWPGYYPKPEPRHAFKHHKNMYMQAKTTRKHKNLKAAPAASDTQSTQQKDRQTGRKAAPALPRSPLFA